MANLTIAQNNVQNVKFLRNGALYTTHDEAYEALTGFTLTTEQDGTIILARYVSGDNVKTLAGLVYADATYKTITIIDVEGTGEDVEKLRQEINAKLGDGVSSSNTVTAQLTALSGNAQSTSADTSVAGAKAYADELISTLDGGVTAETGSYVVSVSEVDGKISGTTVEFPDASSVSGDSKVVIDVTQDKGAITATAANLTGVKLDGYQEGTDADIAATDTLGEALGKLQAQINAMDLTVVSGDGEVITAVSEADGKVSAEKAAIKDVKLTGYVKDDSKTGAIAATDDVEDALSKIENNIAAAQSATTLSAADKSINVVTAATGTTVALNIRSGERVLKLDSDATNGGIYTDINVVKITESLPATVKERYELRDSDNVKIGESIDIAKDSHIVSITYITDTGDTHYQNLEYVYIDASGETKTEYVDISSLVLEAEFASGVTVTNHVAHGVVDPASESFLTVGADGFKLSGVQNAINDAIDALDVAVINPGEGKYIYAIEENDGKIAASGANVSEAVLNNYTKGGDSGAVASSDSLNEAISKLENQIDAAEEAAMAAATVIASGSSADTAEHLEIATTTDSTTGAKTYTFDLKDIASQTDLTELSGKTITAITSTNGSIAATISNEAGNKTANIQTDADKIQMSGFSADSTSALSGIAESDSIATAFEKTNAVITENERVTAEALTDLDTRVNTISGDVNTIKEQYISGVSVNGNAVTVENHVAPISISAATSATTATTANAIVVDTDANGNITLGLNYIDAGLY